MKTPKGGKNKRKTACSAFVFCGGSYQKNIAQTRSTLLCGANGHGAVIKDFLIAASACSHCASGLKQYQS
ncbi:hypothetical protein [Comamonas suwonensis]|uniref:hypothetical protein n=1 Tax=Comamonas suwonensis TaxID=2606214 RepID=UPI00145D2EE1|nr:hypothetical protein [Comamonas suwonensis]MBI1623553.1 hypothetical protein [Comamonas suwonensis]